MRDRFTSNLSLNSLAINSAKVGKWDDGSANALSINIKNTAGDGYILCRSTSAHSIVMLDRASTSYVCYTQYVTAGDVFNNVWGTGVFSDGNAFVIGYRPSTAYQRVMQFTTDKFVGIGESTPIYIFDVQPDANVHATMRLKATGTGGAKIYLSRPTSTQGAFVEFLAGTTDEWLFGEKSGNTKFSIEYYSSGWQEKFSIATDGTTTLTTATTTITGTQVSLTGLSTGLLVKDTDSTNVSVGIGTTNLSLTAPNGFNAGSIVEIQARGTGNDSAVCIRGSGTAQGIDLWQDWSTGSVYVDNRYNGAIILRNTTAGTPVTLLTSNSSNFTIGQSVKLSTIKSGATQSGANAAAGELWKTASHATLPDNVVMIGV